MSDPAAPFRVLCVCTGNVCRSPAAERLLARALGPGASVSSAGTSALVGRPVEPAMADLLRAGGADPEGFVARPLTAALLREADLVLAMAREHRAAAVQLLPAVVRRTFTLRELARLLAEVDPRRLPAGPVGVRARTALPLAAAHRRQADPAADDVPDPYGRPREAFVEAFGQVRTAVDGVAAVLRGPAQPLG